MPAFTLDVAKALLDHMPDLRYDQAADTFIWTPEDTGDPETFGSASIVVNGHAVKVYPVGSGSWCWDAVSVAAELTEQTAEQRWQSICNDQGWDDASQIVHLEGFLRERGLLRDFVEYASRAAMEETSDPSRFDKATIVAEMKRDVAALIAAGVIPDTVKTFSELHDYIDANSLGGFCDDEFAGALIAHHGGRDANEGMPDAIDEWAAGRPARARAEQSPVTDRPDPICLGPGRNPATAASHACDSPLAEVEKDAMSESVEALAA